MSGDLKVENLLEGKAAGNESRFEKNKSRIQLILMISIGILIAAILFIVLEIPLLAGTCVILAACLIYMASRKILFLLTEIAINIREFLKSNEKKEDVISNFSHKIREPLNNLVIIGELLLKTDLNKKQRELLETFVASNNNMVTTVNELTMESAGSISYEVRNPIRFNLISTIQNTIELYNLKDKTNIEILLESLDQADFEFLGDPITLKQIYLDLFNLIENQDYDNKTTVRLTLEKPINSVHECLVNMKIEVDRNLQLIDLISSKSLAAKLIVLSNGTYNHKVDTDFSVLTITMPFSKAVAEQKKQISSQKIEELKKYSKNRKDLKDINVLLVEDNLINQKITLLTLRPLVKRIDAATNGKEALDMLGTSQYDLILMDIQMPVMTGLVAAEKIRATGGQYKFTYSNYRNNCQCDAWR